MSDANENVTTHLNLKGRIIKYPLFAADVRACCNPPKRPSFQPDFYGKLLSQPKLLRDGFATATRTFSVRGIDPCHARDRGTIVSVGNPLRVSMFLWDVT